MNQALAQNRAADDIANGGGGESTKEKFIRKVKENPLVPVGKILNIFIAVYQGLHETPQAENPLKKSSTPSLKVFF